MRLRSLAMASLCALAASCKGTRGPGDASSEIKSDDRTVRQRGVVLVVMGGFNSCGKSDRFGAQKTSRKGPLGMDMYERLQALTRALNDLGVPVGYVVSCYEGMSSTRILHTNTSQMRASLFSSAVPWDDPRGLFAQIDEFRGQNDRPTFVIGHSYGGWLAANYVAWVGHRAADGNRRQLVQGLYTIDPVSPYHCNQSRFAASAGTAVFRGQARGSGCQSAPPQLTSLDRNARWPTDVAVTADDDSLREKIQVATDQTDEPGWVNYYQTDDRALHSGPVPTSSHSFTNAAGRQESDQFPVNEQIRYEGRQAILPVVYDTPHTSIDGDLRVWEDIGNLIGKHLDARDAGRGTGASLTDERRTSGASDAQPSKTPTLPEIKLEEGKAARVKAMAEASADAYAPLSAAQARELEEVYGETRSEGTAP